MEYKTIISIHALTGSATYIMTIFSGSTSLFQSTHPRGVRLRTCLERSNLKRFQSTHPRGVRPMLEMNGPDEEEISIHALTGSATKSASGKFLSIIISIHALTGSATVFFLAFHIFCIISIHTLTGSATPKN